MVLDSIEYYLHCEHTTATDCFNYSCKYEWLCMNYQDDDFAQMFYSEGE